MNIINSLLVTEATTYKELTQSFRDNAREVLRLKKMNALLQKWRFNL